MDECAFAKMMSKYLAIVLLQALSRSLFASGLSSVWPFSKQVICWRFEILA